ncbi:hypothetical protein WJX79_001006 [Trebouxia sp. C0005]|nr:MAG: hypothetical protein FRX49_10292 [Trebouxia sp. A1-2]
MTGMLARRLQGKSLKPLLSCYHTAVLSFGEGSQGALGCSSLGDNYEPEEVNLTKDIAKVAAGHYHSLAINLEGKLFTWGRNNEGQLGQALQPLESAATPAAVDALAKFKVMSAAASGVASFAVVEDGTVWGWGSSKRGQLGLGQGIVEALKPQRLPGLEGITQVSAGWGHACALREDGQLFSWGYPQHGRLGHSLAPSQAQDEQAAVMGRLIWQPQPADLLSPVQIKQVACGLDHTVAVAQNGQVYAFGDNSLCQLGRAGGMGVQETSADAAAWIVRDKEGADIIFTKVAAGLGHCLGVTHKGDVMAWGWAAAGQLGLGQCHQGSHTVVHPTPIFGLPENNRALVAAARVHSVLASEDLFVDPETAHLPHDDTLNSLTQFYAWGSGHNGRLGLGYQQDMTVPEMVSELDGAEILDVACGNDHTLVLIRL